MSDKFVFVYVLVVAFLIVASLFAHKPTAELKDCKIASEAKEIPKCEPKFDINAPGFTM